MISYIIVLLIISVSEIWFLCSVLKYSTTLNYFQGLNKNKNKTFTFFQPSSVVNQSKSKMKIKTNRSRRETDDNWVESDRIPEEV